MNITINNDLSGLTDQIRNDIERRERGKDEWVEATIDLCQHLAEARAKFKDDKSFGAWFDASGVNLNKDERAAAISMGKEINLAREVLEATDRRSLRMIHSKEFRFRSAAKPKKKIPQKKVKKETTPELEKALHVYDRRKAAGEPLTYEAIQEEAGVSATPVRVALAQRKAEEKMAQTGDIVLSMSAKEKFDAKVRAYQKQIDLEAETRAMNEARKQVEEWHIPEYMKTLRTVQKLLEWRRGGGIMTRLEYRAIQRVLHPDTGPHVSDEKRNEAFRLFTQYEVKLVADNEQADLKKVSTLPQTVEELLARRKKK